MNETAPSAAVGGGSAFTLAPLPANQLPPAVANLCAGPVPMKLMAAKGMAPLRPRELLTALYQLSFDADGAVKAAALASVGALPDAVVAGPLGEPLPPVVIHLFAEALPAERVRPLEKILYNQTTADDTFVLLAGRLREAELEVIFQNEARLLRCPAILEALYLNPVARMSSLNRAIELLARNGVRADGIPSFDEVAKSIGEDTAATTDEADSGFFAALGASEDIFFGTELADLDADNPLSGSGDLAANADGAGQEGAADSGALTGLELDLLDEPAAPVVATSGGAKGKKEEAGEKKKSVTIDFGRLKLYEKIRLATLGNAYCRQNLMRDPNRMVALAAIRSPRITDSEIVKAAGNRTVCEDVVRYIAGQRDLIKNYQVRLSLVQNPKCPVQVSLKFLSSLGVEDLKSVARSKNVASALSTGARRILQARKPD